MRKTKYTREVLAPVVAKAKSYREVLESLGLAVTGGSHRLIAARIRQADIDTSHFPYGKTAERGIAIEREILEPLIANSTSYRQVLMKLALPTVGRPHRQLKQRIIELGLDTSHFPGRGWARGWTKETHPGVALVHSKNVLRNDQVFIENGPLAGGPKLLPRLLALGWSYRCVWCGISEWRGERLVLHLDHMNGINNDNRLENLRLLCPNCHSQTDTYCNRAREEAACYTWRQASVM